MKQNIIPYFFKTLKILRYCIGAISALCFALLPLYLIFFRGITQAFHVGALIWSFFVLCVPFSIASSVFSLPCWLMLGLPLPLAEPISWIAALTLNIYTICSAPQLYLKAATTHILYRIIANPWPYWLIIISCAATMLFRTLTQNSSMRRSHFFRFLCIRFLLIALSLGLLFRLTSYELIIILNIQG